jgi:hypothetical protein
VAANSRKEAASSGTPIITARATTATTSEARVTARVTSGVKNQ